MDKKVLDGILNDSFLTWKDKGILVAFIRWSEKGEKVSMMKMLDISNDGITAIRSSVKFLMEEGYLERVYHGNGRQGTSVEYLVNEERFSGMNE